ncbi:metalloregulator ArsR/SmtB family transcription factor, partial [bacterium]|nr:metalloregulator ArsR/SmtB family transcription factor [bacterium]
MAKARGRPTEPKTRARFEARARIIKSLAHPTRLYLVDELSRGERCVCDLTELVGTDVSTVSKHLALLRNAGIVDDEKRGAFPAQDLAGPRDDVRSLGRVAGAAFLREAGGEGRARGRRR